MTADDKPPEGLSLRRWSQRKFAAAREKNAPVTAANPVAAPATVRRTRIGRRCATGAAPTSATTLPPSNR